MYKHRIQKLKALHDSVLVSEMKFEERRTNSGIVIPNDNAKDSGIRPRWARVYAVGPDQRDVVVGQYVCVAHGRWTRGVTIEDESGSREIRRVDNNDILLVSDTEPMDETFSDKV